MWASESVSAGAIYMTLIVSTIAIYYYLALRTSRSRILPGERKELLDPSKSSNLTALQLHVQFWDRDCDKIIYPHDVYNGFRDIGFNVPFSITALLIPVFFSYPTRLGHSFFPDPLFRIYVESLQKAKHGSDTGVYDLDGHFRPQTFEDMFEKFDSSRTGSLGAKDLLHMVAKNRVAADFAGWTFAYMEWITTWLLLQRSGRICKDDLKQCYDGTVFWRLSQERSEGKRGKQGYGWKEFYDNALNGFRSFPS